MYDTIDITKTVYSEYLLFSDLEKLDFIYRISFPGEEPTVEEEIQSDISSGNNTVVCMEFSDFFLCAGNNLKDLNMFILHELIQEGFIFGKLTLEEEDEIIKMNQDVIKGLEYVKILYILDDTGIGLSNN